MKSLKQHSREEPPHTCRLSEVLKELLVEDEGHAADLLHLSLRCRVPVDEVSRDGDCQLAPELLTPKPYEGRGSRQRVTSRSPSK